MLLARVSRNLWFFGFPTSVSGFWVIAFEQLLDALDRALQLVDQIFIGNGKQFGKDSANLRPDLGIFLATSLHFELVLSIYRIPDGDAGPHEQSTKPLQQPMRSVAEIRH